MTGFGPSPDQLELIGTIEQACTRAGLPGALTRDDALGTVTAAIDRLANQVGIVGLAVPESCGGAGGSFVDLYLTAVTLGRFAAPTWPVDQALAAWALATVSVATEPARELVRNLIAGQTRVAVAPVPDTAIQPTRTGRVSGELPAVALAAGTDALLVAGPHLLAWVDLADAGVRTQSLGRLDLVRDHGAISLQDCAVRILAQGPGVGALIRAAALTLTTADAIGGSRSCLDQVLAYVSERQQFGRPIAAFQAVQHQIADLVVQARPVRAIALGAAYRVDQAGVELGTEAHNAFRLAAMARNQAVEAFVAVTRRAVELHGAYGFTWDCPVNLFLRRALVDRVLGGTPTELRRELAGDDPLAAARGADWPYPFAIGL
ncbi:acyl-CoA dehydrogenase family protein [Nakamurella lactea]|uniref:acyl-CoA dehydrogenase family protein n=1 Tax=Nakamurella lactea TaxID=459515 RepID=UPI00040060FC|nr:acyl-CoA dehydrogenase family protein [Nakamurella lactea]